MSRTEPGCGNSQTVGRTTFYYQTGWRLREVLKLESRQIDFDSAEIRLDSGSTKDGEGRVICFTNELRRVLTEQRSEADALKPSGVTVRHVFFCTGHTTRGKLIKRAGKPIRGFRRSWKSALTKAGCPGRPVHDFRRTAVRNMTRAGISENVAMSLSGHKTRSVFDRYDIISVDDKRAADRKLNEAASTAAQTAAHGLFAGTASQK